ncbi:hypothetical protein [Bacillus pumilus]|nr:hypothetical protein [Bacillus pumilus]
MLDNGVLVEVVGMGLFVVGGGWFGVGVMLIKEVGERVLWVDVG